MLDGFRRLLAFLRRLVRRVTGWRARARRPGLLWWDETLEFDADVPPVSRRRLDPQGRVDGDVDSHTAVDGEAPVDGPTTVPATRARRLERTRWFPSRPLRQVVRREERALRPRRSPPSSWPPRPAGPPAHWVARVQAAAPPDPVHIRGPLAAADVHRTRVVRSEVTLLPWPPPPTPDPDPDPDPVLEEESGRIPRDPSSRTPTGEPRWPSLPATEPAIDTLDAALAAVRDRDHAARLAREQRGR